MNKALRGDGFVCRVNVSVGRSLNCGGGVATTTCLTYKNPINGNPAAIPDIIGSGTD